MYTWGYIKDAVLAYLDLSESEALKQGIIRKFPFYANTVITEICSAIKPKRTFAEFEIIVDKKQNRDDTYKLFKMPDDFVSFGDDVCTREWTEPPFYDTYMTECHDDDFAYRGNNELVFFKPGKYLISYNARWQTFAGNTDNDTELTMPLDIAECIPLYIASQCYKIDDEYKSATFRNEYEMALARIDDTDFKQTKTFRIGGDW